MAVRIERINHRFEGEFQHGKKTYSLPFVLPGDTVSYRLVRRGRKRKALIDSIERADPPEQPEIVATDPGCPHAGVCGGCRARHLQYHAQFQLKTAPVIEQMNERFGMQPELHPTVVPENYRNRMDFVVERGIIGLRGAGDYRAFIDIAHCANQKHSGNAALALVRLVLERHPGASKDREQNSGALKYITIRSGDESGAIILTVDQSEHTDPAYRAFRSDLLQSLLQRQQAQGASELFGFTLVETMLDDPQSEVSAPPGGKPLCGDGSFYEKLGGIRFRVPYDSFFQPNPAGFDPIIDWSLQQISSITSEIGEGSLVDLYSGAGVLSSIISSRSGVSFTSVLGMESVSSSVELSAANFPDNAPPLDFRVIDLNKPPADTFHGTNASLIIADPPRAGLSPSLRKLIRREAPAPFMLYISCNPHSQLEDMHTLAKAYEPVSAFLTDPFAHTPHLEQAIWMRRRDSES